jgi:hypothetical protein
MSDTPRTEAMVTALLWRTGEALQVDAEFADFARELERENSALQKENAALREQVEQMRSVINEMADRFGRPEFKTRLFDDFMKMRRDLRHERAARAKEAKP